MAVSEDFLAYVLEQLALVARVSTRRMFGGVGLYADGLFFALIGHGALYFKVDDSNRGDYLARGAKAFQPFADKPDLSMSYFEVPAEVLDDPEELARWARKSQAVALNVAQTQVRVRPRKRVATRAPRKAK